MDATTPPSLGDDIAEALAYANQGPSLSRDTTRRLVRELTERTAGLDHLQRLFRLATRVEQRVGDAVECSCTWSYGRPGVRTARPADCPVHGARPADEPTEADPLSYGRLLDAVTTAVEDGQRSAQEVTNAVWALVGGRPAPCPYIVTADEGTSYCALGGRPAAPTRDEIDDAIGVALSEHAWVHGTGEIGGDGINEAAGAVVALLSRSAAEPPAFDPETFKRFAATADPQALADLIEQTTGARVESITSGVAAEPPDDIADAARELIAAEDEMHQRDSEYEEAVERVYDMASQGACLDRAIEGRHAYTNARKALVALLSGSTEQGVAAAAESRVSTCPFDHESCVAVDCPCECHGVAAEPNKEPKTQLHIGNPMCVCSHMRDVHDEQGNCKGEWRGGECFCDAFDEGDDGGVAAEPKEHGDGR